jgi:tRNA pseudouridine55 synthase
MQRSLSHGLLVLDKPGGVTSRSAVDRAQQWFPPGTRIGHTGTLDPLATGVLVLCIGAATRLTEYVQRMEKTYHAGLLLGARSDTDDIDGRVEAVTVAQPPVRECLAACLQGFLGAIEQVPPGHSAARVRGRRAYDLARRGQEVSLRPRRVQIHALDVLAYEYPRLELMVRCGKGTYIRSLARDLGGRLGCGALVEQLRRTRVGPFDVADALSLETERAAALSSLLPLSAAVTELPAVTLQRDEVGRLGCGQTIRLSDSFAFAGLSTAVDEMAVFDETGALVGIAALDCREQSLRPKKVLERPCTEYCGPSTESQ